MGRRQFRQDLASATQQPPQSVTGIRTNDDGEVSFVYSYGTLGSSQAVNLQLLALNVDEYPYDNEYMIYVRDGDSVDPRILNTFGLICPLIRNQTIQTALSEISSGLHQALTSGEASNPIVLSQSSDAEDIDCDHDQDHDTDNDESPDEWFGADEDAAFGFDEQKKARLTSIGRNLGLQLNSEDIAKIKSDLRQVKEAGFKVGIFNDLTASGIICVSIRTSKLGISEEVMQAWGVESQQYFVLLVRCVHGYRTIEKLQEEPHLIGATEIRLGLCSSYKPNIDSALEAFADTSQDSTKASQNHASTQPDDLRPLFIGRPLNDLFKNRFTRIVKFREVYGLSWSGAEQLVHDTQGAMTDDADMEKYDRMYDDTNRALPSVVLADVMSERRLKLCSMPLVAMQFALRHFVRCTEFCLVCHCNSGSTFEALKPYVCSNPLCLFQYMALGFGPSIEWEILSQPYVVDLLISFCYAQAQARRLRSYPVGIDLRVPILPKYNTALQTYQTYNSIPGANVATAADVPKPISVRYNGFKRELLFDATSKPEQHCLRKGDFIALETAKTGKDMPFQGILYHRIEEVMLPTIRLGREIHPVPLTKPLPDHFTTADCYPFHNNFDELSDHQKAGSILTLLDTLPPVKEMQEYLMKHATGQEMELRQWRDRISPAALNVLRWIIASNRSCIMQVDTVLAQDAAKSSESREDRVSGMDEFMQFRFAQGAPDKEQRFIDCVQKFNVNKEYPTIFAWHGSPLSNWHSIIREGLDFKEVMHGRAFGNGVYMSSHAQTSMGYAGMQSRHGGVSVPWPNSELKITSAMSLNEVVNNTTKFISTNPHLVVADTDWIQTRYLLVKTATAHSKSQLEGMEKISQDPGLTAMGMVGSKVEIPITAVSKSRRPAKAVSKQNSRKRKSIGSGLIEEPIMLIDSDDESVATLDEDRDYLIDDESHSGQTPIELDSDIEMCMDDIDTDDMELPRKRMRQSEPETALRVMEGLLIDTTKTDFVPGELDMTNVRILPAPTDATRSASNTLLKAFDALLKTQKTTPAHELGWYINPEQIENMYQWIVELHSFDQDLPLAQDMKAVGCTSVVLEMRFTNQYPFAPPFVRVVKPRFLPFSQRGGGHVTEGGAICMELLTNNGWSAVSSIESVLLQVRLAMCDKEPPARLASTSRQGGSRDGVYGVGEAIAAYERACRNHGWTVPAAFAQLQRQ